MQLAVMKCFPAVYMFAAACYKLPLRLRIVDDANALVLPHSQVRISV